MTVGGGLFDLRGHRALVTGCTGGLGLAIVDALASHGARILASDVRADAVEWAARGWRERGHAVETAVADLSREDEVFALARQCLEGGEATDILVHNAGIQGPAGPLGETTAADWEAVMTVNLRSALWLSAHVLPAMAQRGRGSVVLISSIAGLRGNRSIGLYGLSKAALSQLARNLAVEYGPKGVRVNAVAPGLIRTPLAAPLLADEVFMSRRLALTPLRRVGEPDEVAGVVVMLASRAGGFVSGQTLVVDGGTVVSDGS